MIPLPSYSQIVELIKKGATLEAQEQIMQLREAAIKLQEENVALREENKKLHEDKEIAANLEFEDHVYCPSLWELSPKIPFSSRRAVHITFVSASAKASYGQFYTSVRALTFLRLAQRNAFRRRDARQ